MVEPMMTARQVADVLGVHENWVYDQAARGELPSYKIGGARRFRAHELEAWLDATPRSGPASLRTEPPAPAAPIVGRRRSEGCSLGCSDER